MKKKESIKKIAKILIVVIVILILIIVTVFAFYKKNNKELIMYKYNNMIYNYSHDNIENINKNNLKKYIYKCKYDKCGYIINDDFKGQRGIKQNWILIRDTKEGDLCEGDYCSVSGGEHFLYNVETKKKIVVTLKDYDIVKDVWLENNKPLTLIVKRDDRDILIDVKTGKTLFDTKNIIYGGTYSRNLEIVNTNFYNFYAFTSSNYSGAMLYDANLNFITEIDSLKNFDTKGNIIDFKFKDEKIYFEVLDLKGNLIRKSNLYDNAFMDEGYIVVEKNNNVIIINSDEETISNISNVNDKRYFTTKYNEYYLRGNGISVFEINFKEYINPVYPDFDNVKSVFQYFYNFNSNKLEKYEIDIDELRNKE